MGDEIAVYDDALVYKLSNALLQHMQDLQQKSMFDALRRRTVLVGSNVTEVCSGSSVLHAYTRLCVRACTRKTQSGRRTVAQTVSSPNIQSIFTPVRSRADLQQSIARIFRNTVVQAKASEDIPEGAGVIRLPDGRVGLFKNRFVRT